MWRARLSSAARCERINQRIDILPVGHPLELDVLAGIVVQAAAPPRASGISASQLHQMLCAQETTANHKQCPGDKIHSARTTPHSPLGKSKTFLWKISPIFSPKKNSPGLLGKIWLAVPLFYFHLPCCALSPLYDYHSPCCSYFSSYLPCYALIFLRASGSGACP